MKAPSFQSVTSATVDGENIFMALIPSWHWWSRTLLPMQETSEIRVPSLGREDPLEQDMATLSSILVWRIPWTEVPGGLQSTGSQRLRHN